MDTCEFPVYGTQPCGEDATNIVCVRHFLTGEEEVLGVCPVHLDKIREMLRDEDTIEVEGV